MAPLFFQELRQLFLVFLPPRAKALAAWGIDEGIAEWWHEDDFLPTCGKPGGDRDEPTITCLAENFALGNWLSGSAGIDTNLYVYDNDGDTFDTNGDGCADGSIWQGVFLNIWDPALLDVAEEVDDIVDNGDGPSCGKIRALDIPRSKV